MATHEFTGVRTALREPAAGLRVDGRGDLSLELHALFALMQEKPLGQITISALSDKAQLDRRTFYRHFKTTEDVVRYRVRELAAEYEKIFHPGIQTTQEIAHAFFAVFFEHRDLLCLLHRQALLHLVLFEMNSLFPELHAKYHIDIDPYASMRQNAAYALAYHAGGFRSVMVLWLKNGCSQDQEELAAVVGHLLPEYI